MKKKKAINSSIVSPKSPLQGILSQSSWWTLNKAITILLGFDASLLLSDLTSRQDMWNRLGKLDENGFFYCLRKDIAYDTSISEQRQIRALNILIKYKLVETIKKKEIPPKLYYRVNYDNINNLIKELHVE